MRMWDVFFTAWGHDHCWPGITAPTDHDAISQILAAEHVASEQEYFRPYYYAISLGKVTTR